MGDFNLAEVLRGQLQNAGADVSKLDTSGGLEQIEYIDIGLLDGDPRNRRDLRGLEELAANIELLGLRQPLRVRESKDAPGRFVIVSGHRRQAALQRLVDDGRAEFARVPCIRDKPAQSGALQELRLIFDNLDTQPYSDAEKAKLAARVEELLFLLKEEGMEFPGRMRDQVAAACRISAPKLARLKVIREKLVPEYMGLFERDKLPEQTAYALARLPEDFQKRLAAALPEIPSGNIAEKVLKKYNEGWRWEPELQCPDGKSCKRGDVFLRRDCEASSWQPFCGGKTCCLECEAAKARCSPCERMCSKAKAQRKAERDEREKAIYERKQKEGRKYQKETQVYAKRLLPAVNAAGLTEDTEIPWTQYRRCPLVSQIRQWAAGEFNDPAKWYEAELVPGKCGSAAEAARLLGCSTDFLLGLTDDFRPSADTEPPSQEVPAAEASGTELEEGLPESEESIPEASVQDVSNLDTISGGEPCDEPEEVPAQCVRWESRGRTPPEDKLILTYELTNDGPAYHTAVWDGSSFKTPDGKKVLTGLRYTKWLRVPFPGSGDALQLVPPEQAEGQLVISGWMHGGTFPREPCDVVAEFLVRTDSIALEKVGRPCVPHRHICRFDGTCFRFGRNGSKIDAECIRWMALPPVESDVSNLDTNEGKRV